MKTALLALTYVAAAAALVMPPPRQDPLVQDDVAVAGLSSEEAPDTKILVDDLQEESKVESCFCAGGSICCNLTDSKIDCGFGTCGI